MDALGIDEKHMRYEMGQKTGKLSAPRVQTYIDTLKREMARYPEPEVRQAYRNIKGTRYVQNLIDIVDSGRARE